MNKKISNLKLQMASKKKSTYQIKMKSNFYTAFFTMQKLKKEEG